VRIRTAPDLIVLDAVIGPEFVSGGRAATGLAVSGDRILAIGTTDEIRSLADAATTIVGGGGRRLLPAFTDSHTHFQRGAILRAEFIDLDETRPRQVSDVVASIAERAERTPDGEWIQVDNLSQWKLADRRLPDRRDLDGATQVHPVVVRGVGKHVVVANSVALSLAGITRETEDPPGGRIERDERGEPTGVLHERAKLRLDADRADTVIRPLEAPQRQAALELGIRELNRLGITAIHEIVRAPEELADFSVLREQGRLNVRVHHYIRAVEAVTRLDHVTSLGLRSGFGDDRQRIGGIKVSIDGSVMLRNAAIYGEYPDSEHGGGIERISPTELGAIVRACDANGLQVAVHAVGQRALDIALDAFEAAGTHAGSGHRHRVEHAYLPPRPGQLERMARLGLILSTQPADLYDRGDYMAEVTGWTDLTGYMPIRTAHELGIRVLLNTDFPTAPLDPMIGLRSAVYRRTESGQVIDPGEAIDVRTALRMMIENPVYAEFREGHRGIVAEGALADLMLLSEDPLADGGFRDEPDATEPRVELTTMAGRVVHATSAMDIGGPTA
jgi:predicted amidohydrolase YtcJ